MNEKAQTHDAIQRIDADGRVHFMPYTIEIMKEVLGFDCDSFAPEESLELARQQMACFAALERRYRQ